MWVREEIQCESEMQGLEAHRKDFQFQFKKHEELNRFETGECCDQVMRSSWVRNGLEEKATSYETAAFVLALD